MFGIASTKQVERLQNLLNKKTDNDFEVFDKLAKLHETSFKTMDNITDIANENKEAVEKLMKILDEELRNDKL